jgi:tripartite-type tricarboxylate transporter receptor subunit TctC
MSSRAVAVVLVAALLAGVAGPALAQGYPTKPIRVVVPFPPGGISDVLSRILGVKLTESLGQPIVIENRAGAGTTIAAAEVAKSAPDGYTLYFADVTTQAINATLYRKLPYDTVKDFSPITMVAFTPLILVVHPSVPARSVKELIDLAKSKPGQLNMASSGNGTITHLAGELFKSMAGLDMLHVPYTGSAPAATALLGGQVSLLFSSVPPALPHVKTGRLRGLAVTTARRSPALPDIPTMSETLPGFELTLWSAVLGPAGIPREIVNKLNAEIAKALKLPDVRERFALQSAEPSPSTPEELAAHIRADIDKLGKLVKASGAHID